MNATTTTPVPTLIIVGADKGGVGKTMLCRTLLDYFKLNGVRPIAFDTEPEPGVLRRFYGYAKPVNVEAMRGQMQVFDEVPNAGVTVVDLKAGVLSRVLEAMSNAGLLKDVRAGAMRMVVLHVLGSTEASLREIAATSAVLAQGGEHILIKNHATDGQFFEWDAAAHEAYFGGKDAKLLLDIPHLDGMACDAIEQAGVSFNAFLADTTKSNWLRGSVRHWRELVFAELARAKLIPPPVA